MNLPKLITDLVEAQNSHDGAAYASLFSENAVVFDEGKTHTGKEAIQNWIEKSNEEYQSVLKPISYKNSDNGSVLEAEVSGTFPGSPTVLRFNFTFQHGLVGSLKITG
ncbi:MULTISPECIES: nuclear transport factor 2 family protein [unclassified Chitinophaga]|uniref:nuclear transport factor 2 family protein n=1 Tax=unclassified Chitinophaga TaxID=2619133 RepID=UPI00300FBDC2